MTRTRLAGTTRATIVAALALTGTLSTALARPPTMQHSPGYDARLAESRKAWAQYQWSLYHGQPAVRPLRKPRHYVRPAPRR